MAAQKLPYKEVRENRADSGRWEVQPVESNHLLGLPVVLAASQHRPIQQIRGRDNRPIGQGFLLRTPIVFTPNEFEVFPRCLLIASVKLDDELIVQNPSGLKGIAVYENHQEEQDQASGQVPDPWMSMYEPCLAR